MSRGDRGGVPGDDRDRDYVAFRGSRPCRWWTRGRRGVNAPLTPRARANAEQRAARPRRVGVRRRLGRLGQDQAADRPPAAPDAARGATPERIQCLTFTKAAAAEMAVRLQRTPRRLGHPGRRRARRANCRRSTSSPPRHAAPTRPRAVRPGAGPARRHAHRHHPRLLPVAAAPLPAGSRAVAAFPPDRRPRRRRRHDRGARGHARRCQPAEAMQRRAGACSPAWPRPSSSAATSSRCNPTAQRLQAALALGPKPDRGAAPRARRHRGGPRRRSSPHAVNWQAERRLARRACADRLALGSPKIRQNGHRACCDWLGLDAEIARRELGRLVRGIPHQGTASRAPPAPSSTRTWPSAAELLAAVPAPKPRASTRSRTAPGARRGRGVGRAGDARRAGAATPTPRARTHAGLLDYDDLIGRTSDLLVDPGAAWVLYKLDGGLDHLLLDEVQDTAPAQWRIAHALTEEFFAGVGRRARGAPHGVRGRRPQAVDLLVPGRRRRRSSTAPASRLRRRVSAAGPGWREVPLDVSFRSTEPVLALVDAVFADPLAAAGVVDARRHAAPLRRPRRARRPRGAVAARAAAGRAGPGALDGAGATTRASAPRRSSWPRRLADWIATQTSGAVLLASRGRTLAPGDVMVLVRRRNDFARALVRALKSRGVPVAGLDRLVLTEQPAVQDLMALADALLLPQDDLSFACLLTSPLGGLTDDEPDGAGDRPAAARCGRRCAAAPTNGRLARGLGLLRRLAGPRRLRSARTRCSPRRWAPLGGRARLFARLGAEAAEPVDELLQRRARLRAAPIRRRCRASCTGCAAPPPR